MRWRWAIPLAVLVFLYALVVRAPAASVYTWVVAPRSAAVQAYGIGGTLGDGHVATLALRGRPLLQDLDWRLRPWWLLLGRLAMQVRGGDTGIRIAGEARLSPSTLTLSGFTADSDLKTALATVGYPFVPVDGLAELGLTTLQLERDGIADLDGRLLLRGMRWSLGGTQIPLGEFAVDARTDDKRTVNADVTTLSGPLELSGPVSLTADGTYDVNLKLKAKPKAPAQLVDLLKALGRTDTRGYYHIRRHGRLALPFAQPGS